MGNLQLKKNNVQQIKKTSIVGKFRAMQKDSYEPLDIDLNIFFTRELNNEEMKIYDKIYEFKIVNLKKSSYVYNLRKLPELRILRLIDIENPSLFSELPYLKKLFFLDSYNLNLNHMKPEIYIKTISQCTELKHLEIKLDVDYFPKDFLQLENITSFVFYSTLPNTKINIPIEMCNLKQLNYLEFLTDQKFIINEDKMIILNFENSVIVPEYIKYLKIFSIKDGDINNLPTNIEFLEIRQLNKLPLNNLPSGLKKLTIYIDEVEYFDINTDDYVIKIITEDDIKLPFGCELYMNIYNNQ